MCTTLNLSNLPNLLLVQTRAVYSIKGERQPKLHLQFVLLNNFTFVTGLIISFCSYGKKKAPHNYSHSPHPTSSIAIILWTLLQVG